MGLDLEENDQVAGVEEFIEAGEAEGIAAGWKGFEVERAIGGGDPAVP